MRQLLRVEDYRAVARARLPRLVFDYIDGGAESEQTLRANEAAFEQVALRPRGGRRAGSVSLEVTVLGARLALPVLLAPCGGARMVDPAGDLAGARAAGRAGTAFVLSAMSCHGVEEVVAASKGPVWFQLYHLGEHEATARVVERAAKAGAAALVVTIDTAAGSRRERDWRNGTAQLLGPSRLQALPYFGQLLRRPRWLVGRLRDGLLPPLANVTLADGKPRVLGRGFLPRSLAWEDLSWVRERWDGPLVVKGLLTPDDAVRAAEEGASAVVVSNHGGRQLDGAEATMRALPEVVEAVGGRCEVLLDGGVRRGTDVLKALALGARAVLIGRPWLYGLGAEGERGVDGVLELLRDSMERNLALVGCETPGALSERHVRVPEGWRRQDDRGRGGPEEGTVR